MAGGGGQGDGRIEGGRHLLPVRIHFEDTDLSGLVYHANYLRYMERGRSDLLACLGIDQRAALEAGVGAYAVAEIGIRYLRPARLGDLLTVETRCRAVGAARVEMEQRVLRAGEPLAEARVRAGFLSPAGRPRRQPAEWIERYRQLLAGGGLAHRQGRAR